MRRLLPIVVVISALALAVAAQPQVAVRPFDTIAGVATDRPAGVRGQARLIRPRVDLLADAGRDRASIVIPLPGGEELTANLRTHETQARGYFTAGPLVGQSTAGESVDGEVNLTVVDGVVAGRVLNQGRLYRVRALGRDGIHVIEEIDTASLPPDGHPLVPAGAMAEMAEMTQMAEMAEMAAMAEVAGDGASMVDLLLLYTPAARVAVGGDAAALAEAQAAVNNANLALQNSGVTHRYQAVHIAEIAYTESGSSSTDLSRLAAVGDGHLDQVHGLRDQYDADVVVLLTEASDACGIGYVMGPSSVSTSFAPFAFNVTILDVCAAANLSMAHEIGHNIGLQHDRANAGSSPAFDYAYGYKVPGLARTVMAYACETGGTCARRSIFSTPLANFPSTGTVAGTTTEDNARAMNLTAPYVANFRDSTCGYTLSATSASVAAAGGTGTITVTASSGCRWNAVSNDTTAVTVTGGATSNGTATVSYSVSATSSSRSATMTIAGQAVTITQSVASCTPTMFVTSGTPAPFTRTGGTGSITFTMPTGCESSTWSVTDDVDWVTWTSATSGTGGGTASFAVAVNGTESLRGANITFAGPDFTSITRTIQQLGSTLSVSIPSQQLWATKGSAESPLQSYSPQQKVTVTIGAPDSRAWTATSDQSWLQVVEGSGSGTGQFYVRVANPSNVIGASSELTGNITVSASGLTPQVWPFTLRVYGIAASGAPFGSFDTPIGGTTVSGAIPVTGWALSDETITSIDVWRDAVTGIDAPAAIQSNGWVFVGQAVQVTGARPDVAAAFPSYAQRNQAGWGYLLLTNMLPHRTLGAAAGGQGAFRLHVTATEQSGTQRQLGEVAITVDNDAATRPFGAIDTPAQGGTATSMYANFGWALARGTALIPTNGSTMHVFIDGAPVGQPTYNQCRGTNLSTVGPFLNPGGSCDDDVATLFASRGHLNVAPGAARGAIGSYVINTSTLTSGVHSIAWSVTDDQGRTEGIGSRLFSVGAGDASAGDLAWDGPLAVTELVRVQPIETREVTARRGFALDAPWETVAAAADGQRHLRVRELDRIEIDLGGPVAVGYLVRGGDLVALPAGAAVDTRGRFTWAPPAAFLGRFDLEFLTTTGRVPLTIELIPQTLGPEHDGLRAHLDIVSPSLVEGWALDPGAWHGAGISTVHVWAHPVDAQGEPAGDPVWMGVAETGVARPDVAAAFGPQFSHAGFRLHPQTNLPSGTYRIVAYFWSARTGRWEDAVVRILRIP